MDFALSVMICPGRNHNHKKVGLNDRKVLSWAQIWLWCHQRWQTSCKSNPHAWLTASLSAGPVINICKYKIRYQQVHWYLSWLPSRETDAGRNNEGYGELGPVISRKYLVANAETYSYQVDTTVDYWRLLSKRQYSDVRHSIPQEYISTDHGMVRASVNMKDQIDTRDERVYFGTLTYFWRKRQVCERR